MIAAAAAAAREADRLARVRHASRMPYLAEEIQESVGPVQTGVGIEQRPASILARHASAMAAAGWEPSPYDPFVEWLITGLHAPGQLRDLVPWLASHTPRTQWFIRETALHYTFSPFADSMLGTQFRGLANDLTTLRPGSSGWIGKVEDFIHTTAHNYRVNDLLEASRLADDPLGRLFVRLSDELKVSHHPQVKGALVALALQVAGEAVAKRYPGLGAGMKDLGETLGAAVDVAGLTEAASLVRGRVPAASRTAPTFLSLSTTLGRVVGVLGGIGGAFQYVASARALVTDPALDPRTSGPGVRNERIGVTLEGIGGALMAGGALLIFIPGGQPFAAALLPAGAAVWGVGTLVRKWDNIWSGLQAWRGVWDMGTNVIAPYYASRAWEWYDRTVNQPISDAVETWKGIGDNAVQIAQAAPAYIREAVVQPAAQVLQEHVVEPVQHAVNDAVAGLKRLFGLGP